MFNIGILKSNLKRFWILPVVITIILFLGITFQMILEVENIKDRQDNISLNIQSTTDVEIMENAIVEQSNELLVNDITNTIEYIPIVEDVIPIQTNEQQSKYLIRDLYSSINLIIIFILPVIISILLFGYINEEKSSSFMHGLPISKKRIYITNVITGIIMYIIPYLINLIILLILNLGDMGNYLENVEIFKWFGLCILFNTVFFSFSTIIGTICASKISHGILTYILMYAPVGMLILLNIIIEKLLYGFNGIISRVEGWAIKLPFLKVIEVFENMSYYNLGDKIDLEISSIIIYILISIVMILIGYFIYKKRKLEVTKEFIAFDIIRSIIKYCATLCVTLLSCTYFYNVLDEEKMLTIIGTLIITVIAYFIIEMILKKTYRVFKSIKGLIVYLLIAIILYAIIENGLFGFETKVPQIDEIKEVIITKYDEKIVFDQKQNIENIINMHKEIVKNRPDGYTEYIIDYILKDGARISRKYEIKEKDYEQYINNMIESEEYLEEKMKFLDNEKEIENIQIHLSYYKSNYKYNNYKTIIIEENQRKEFIEDIKEDIKNKKAGFESNSLKNIYNKNGEELKTIRVNIELKDNKMKYITYYTKDANIIKYIK